MAEGTKITIGPFNNSNPTIAAISQLVQNPSFDHYTENVITASISGTYNIDLSTMNIFDLTLLGNTNITFSNPAPSGIATNATIKFTQGGLGNFTPTFNSPATWGDNGSPIWSTTVGLSDWVTMITTRGTAKYSLFLSGTGF